MDNMTRKGHTMPERDPSERISDFSEVALGIDEERAVSEAKRCLACKGRPCTAGCPVGVAIPEFLALVAQRKFGEAYETIRAANSLPAVTGRVCPQERQCEARCVRGRAGEPVAIGMLERFVADRHARSASPVPEEGKPCIPEDGKPCVAVVGSGPAGLACAGDLAAMGYGVTVFEALHVAGGVLVYGIPSFRLPKEVVAREIEDLAARGVRFVTDAVVGKTVTVRELLETYSAVFLGTGAGLPNFMHIPGENACGVFSANEYLTRINLMKAYEEDAETPVYPARHVAVVGGGNVAMDAARCARRMGAEVTVIYRRSEEDLPARREEIRHAKEEGIAFLCLSNPVEILTDGTAVRGVRCAVMEQGEADASGRRAPVQTDRTFELGADCVIMALGTSPNPLVVRSTPGLTAKPRGELITDEGGMTAIEGVFAGGDAVTGSATVILAMGAGKSAASAIDGYLKEKYGVRAASQT